VLCMKTCTHIIIYGFVLPGTSSVSDKCIEDQNTYLMFNPVFPQNCGFFFLNVGKYGRARQVIDDNTAQALCMLGN